MRLSVDTNVILRLMVRDDPRQTALAARELERAEAVILSLVTLCEAAWVMERTYRFSRATIAENLRALLAVPSVEYDRPEVEAGLAILDLGGDFADGVIARHGRSRRAEVFVSFDQKAIRHLVALGEKARLPD